MRLPCPKQNLSCLQELRIFDADNGEEGSIAAQVFTHRSRPECRCYRFTGNPKLSMPSNIVASWPNTSKKELSAILQRKPRQTRGR